MIKNKVTKILLSAGIISSVLCLSPQIISHADSLNHVNQPKTESIQQTQSNKTNNLNNIDHSNTKSDQSSQTHNVSISKKIQVTVTYKSGYFPTVIKTSKKTVDYGTKLNDNVINIPAGYKIETIHENGTNIGDNLNFKLTQKNTNIIVKLKQVAFEIECTSTYNNKPINGVVFAIEYTAENSCKTLLYTTGKNKPEIIPYKNGMAFTIFDTPKGYQEATFNTVYKTAKDGMQIMDLTSTLTKVSCPVKINYICNGKIISTSKSNLPYETKLTDKLLKVSAPYSINYITVNNSNHLTELSGNVNNLDSNVINVYLTDNSASVNYSATCGTANINGLVYKITTQSGKTYTLTTGENNVLHLPNKAYKSVQVLKVPKGYKTICAPEVNYSSNGNVSINTPLEKLYTTSINLKVIDTSGQILSNNTISGFVGETYIQQVNIPNGYNLISITDNGQTIKNIPSYFGNKNENVIIHVKNENKPISSNKQVTPIVKTSKPEVKTENHHVNSTPIVKTSKPEVKTENHHVDSTPIVKTSKPEVKTDNHHVDSTPIVKTSKPEVKTENHHVDSTPIVKTSKPEVKTDNHHVDSTPIVKTSKPEVKTENHHVDSTPIVKTSKPEVKTDNHHVDSTPIVKTSKPDVKTGNHHVDSTPIVKTSKPEVKTENHHVNSTPIVKTSKPEVKTENHHVDSTPIVKTSKPEVKTENHHNDSKPVVKTIKPEFKALNETGMVDFFDGPFTYTTREPNWNNDGNGALYNNTIVKVIGESNGWYKLITSYGDAWVPTSRIKIITIKPLNEKGMVNVNNSSANIYKNPTYVNLVGNIVGTINNSKNINVIGEINGWYKVQADGLTGWMQMNSVIIGKNSHVPSTGVIDFNGGNFTYMTRNPNWNNDGVGSISNGTEVKIISEHDGWYHIQYGPQESDTAWVPMDRVNTTGFKSLELNGVVAFNDGNFTYVTKHPNWNNDGLGSIVNGSEIYIVGSYNGWYKIEYGTSYAWIPMSRVNTKGYVSMNKAGVVSFSGNPFSYVTQNPNWNNDGVGSINNGTEVTVLASYNGWYKIKYADGIAWIPQSRINTNVPQAIATGVIDFKDGYTYVTRNPNWNNDGLGALSNGTQVSIFQKKDGWYQISFDGRKAWVPMNRVKL